MAVGTGWWWGAGIPGPTKQYRTSPVSGWSVVTGPVKMLSSAVNVAAAVLPNTVVRCTSRLPTAAPGAPMAAAPSPSMMLSCTDSSTWEPATIGPQMQEVMDTSAGPVPEAVTRSAGLRLGGTVQCSTASVPAPSAVTGPRIISPLSSTRPPPASWMSRPPSSAGAASGADWMRRVQDPWLASTHGAGPGDGV